ncbi:MAG: NAD(P)-binding protein [Gammaproteobacteria bacterium]|nr:NAD(P)-binding protein [Gammaproteobacteria bacterium]NIM74097.1 NAD(P)-binding protein [Gammaproteobacteria bacterium]NIN38980.1 NAD(P)-binding protein [Gammaproteobacteria bacterium]NIO25873.1 NAD(P)-binding protein [Gammaproteobacteria bacterium]NIO66504.1 NAD(P)-binding protein [Gammaproteobacteria bacterium]
MKIAIVGTGIAGMTAARMLNRRNSITVFESAGYIGGHTNTIEVADGARTLSVDTGFIVFNELNYPNLCRLFRELGVESRDSDMSFSVHCEKSGVEYNGTSVDLLFAQRRNLLRPRFWGMLAEILRFNREAPRELADGLDDTVSVASYIGQRGYSKVFVDHYLVPLGASLWSCDARRFHHFPMRFVIEFLHNHGMLRVNGRPTWKTVIGGSSRYVAPLVAPFRDRILLNTSVTAVRRCRGGVEVVVDGGHRERFDEVVLACHADQSRRLVLDMDAEEREILDHFPYQVNEAVLHTDTRLLPIRRRAWGSWNYRIPAEQRDRVTVTYNMNMLQGLESARTYCVSLNQTESIDPAAVIRRIRYEHPLFVPGRDEAQVNHGALIRRRGISYCGAYWGYGFHEDGVRSALSVCDAFDVSLAA